MQKTIEALQVLFKVGNKVIKAESDGKIDTGEAIGIAISAVGIVGVFKNLPAIGAELKAITPEDVNQIVEVFKDEFDLPNDELEAKIEAGLEALAQMVIMLLEKKSE